jgi:diacylglycerol kinase family enzyme
MHYAIIANPASGTASALRKRAMLEASARILNADIHGMDTRTADELAQCARNTAPHCDVLVVAGGDGTFSDIINAIDTLETPVAFLPLGTGNALSYALNYGGDLETIARRIKHGRVHRLDLLDCKQGKRGFMMSVGFEGMVVQLYRKYAGRGYGGFCAYVIAFLNAFFLKYRRTTACVTVDEETRTTENLLSFIIVKQPYYGFGMRVVPQAEFADGFVHTLAIDSGLPGCLLGAVTAFAGKNRIGHYVAGYRVNIRSEAPLPLQIDGDFISQADNFDFRPLPGALRIKC